MSLEVVSMSVYKKLSRSYLLPVIATDLELSFHLCSGNAYSNKPTSIWEHSPVLLI